MGFSFLFSPPLDGGLKSPQKLGNSQNCARENPKFQNHDSSFPKFSNERKEKSQSHTQRHCLLALPLQMYRLYD